MPRRLENPMHAVIRSQVTSDAAEAFTITAEPWTAAADECRSHPRGILG
jgi:hypothetical protein